MRASPSCSSLESRVLSRPCDTFPAYCISSTVPEYSITGEPVTPEKESPTVIAAAGEAILDIGLQIWVVSPVEVMATL